MRHASVTGAIASSSQSVREEASRKYSRRQAPSTVTVSPRAPPSDVRPRDTSAPADTSSISMSGALLSIIAATSTGEPPPPSSNHPISSSPIGRPQMVTPAGGGRLTPAGAVALIDGLTVTAGCHHAPPFMRCPRWCLLRCRITPVNHPRSLELGLRRREVFASCQTLLRLRCDASPNSGEMLTTVSCSGVPRSVGTFRERCVIGLVTTVKPL
jgi:hypothetical protein